MSRFKSHGRTWFVLPSGRMVSIVRAAQRDLQLTILTLTVRDHIRRSGEKFCPVSHEYLDVYGGSCDWCGASSVIILVGRETG